MYTNVTAITEHHFIALLTLRLKQRSRACYQEYVKPVYGTTLKQNLTIFHLTSYTKKYIYSKQY